MSRTSRAWHRLAIAEDSRAASCMPFYPEFEIRRLTASETLGERCLPCWQVQKCRTKPTPLVTVGPWTYTASEMRYACTTVRLKPALRYSRWPSHRTLSCIPVPRLAALQTVRHTNDSSKVWLTTDSQGPAGSASLRSCILVVKSGAALEPLNWSCRSVSIQSRRLLPLLLCDSRLPIQGVDPDHSAHFVNQQPTPGIWKPILPGYLPPPFLRPGLFHRISLICRLFGAD